MLHSYYSQIILEIFIDIPIYVRHPFTENSHYALKIQPSILNIVQNLTKTANTSIKNTYRYEKQERVKL